MIARRDDSFPSWMIVVVVACFVFVYLQAYRNGYQRQAEQQYIAAIQAGSTTTNKDRRIAVPIGTDIAQPMNGKCIKMVQKLDAKTVVIHFTDGTRGTITAGSTYHTAADMNCEIVEIAVK